MRPVLGISAVVIAAGSGFAAGKARPAAALDAHAGHDMGVASSARCTHRRQIRSLPPAQMVAIKVGHQHVDTRWPKTVAFFKAKLGS